MNPPITKQEAIEAALIVILAAILALACDEWIITG